MNNTSNNEKPEFPKKWFIKGDFVTVTPRAESTFGPKPMFIFKIIFQSIFVLHNVTSPTRKQTLVNDESSRNKNPIEMYIFLSGYFHYTSGH